MNNPLIQRAQLLYQQQRYDMAGNAIREALMQSPNDGYAHSLLALCLLQQQKFDDATEEAQQAIAIAPDSPFSHYTLGSIFQERNRFAEAEKSAREAVGLGPFNADNWALLSQTFISRQKWSDALESADKGLEADSEHAACVNLRAVALVNLGRKEEASRTIQGALQRDPHSAMGHANQGWTLLHQSKPKEAMEHFAEALRIDPNYGWAREGMVAALKARHLPYRLMLRYFLFMSKFGAKQWYFIIGLVVAYNVLDSMRKSYPDIGPYIVPILIAYVAFILATWLADPLFNLTLLFSRYGRHLLTIAQRIGAIVVGLLLLSGIAMVCVWAKTKSDLALVLAILAASTTLATATAARQRQKRNLGLMTAYASLVLIVGVSGIAIMVQSNSDIGPTLFEACMWGGALSGLVSNLLATRVAKR